MKDRGGIQFSLSRAGSTGDPANYFFSLPTQPANSVSQRRRVDPTLHLTGALLLSIVGPALSMRCWGSSAQDPRVRFAGKYAAAPRLLFPATAAPYSHPFRVLALTGFLSCSGHWLLEGYETSDWLSPMSLKRPPETARCRRRPGETCACKLKVWA